MQRMWGSLLEGRCFDDGGLLASNFGLIAGMDKMVAESKDFGEGTLVY